MTNKEYLNIVYVKPTVSNKGKVFTCYPDPLEIAFSKICNVLTITVGHGIISKLRSKAISGLKRGLPAESSNSHEPVGINLLRGISKVASRFETIEISDIVRKLNYKADLVFVNDIDVAISDLRKISAKAFFWVNDPHISVERYFELQGVKSYDRVFVTVKSLLNRFEERGCRVSWLPVAAHKDYFVGERNEVFDISFVGTIYKNSQRERMINAIKKKFNNFYVGNERQYSMGKVYRSSKIVVNKCMPNGLNMRIFEAMASGALLVTNRVDGLLDLFKEDYHLVCYDNESELISKLEYYLAEHESRRQIAERGRREVMEKHTFDNRVQEILRYVDT